MKSAPLFVRSSSSKLYAKKGVALHLYSKGVATPSLAVLSLFSPLCTLTAQVEAGVGQLNIYTFLAFILQHTELTSMNGVLLTPFNSCLKQVLLAQLTRKGQTAPASAGPCCISTFTTFFFMKKKPHRRQQTVKTDGESRRQFGLSLHKQYLKLKVRACSPPIPTPLLYNPLLFFLFLQFSVALCSLLWTGVSGEMLGETAAPSCFH